MKFKSIAVGQQESNYNVYALSEDGSIWTLDYRTKGYGWYRVSPSVQGEPEFVEAPRDR